MLCFDELNLSSSHSKVDKIFGMTDFIVDKMCNAHKYLCVCIWYMRNCNNCWVGTFPLQIKVRTCHLVIIYMASIQILITYWWHLYELVGICLFRNDAFVSWEKQKLFRKVLII